MKPYTKTQKVILALLPWIAAKILRLLMASVRVTVARGNNYSPLARSKKTRYIYVGWHNELIPSLSYWSGKNFLAMVSQSFDGELAARILMALGFPDPARGSSSRGGASALRTMVKSLAQGRDAVLTPDGPRGPRHEVQEGVLALARLSGLEVVPVSFRCKWVIRLKGWDRMEIPLPFSPAVVIFAEPFKVPRLSSESQMTAIKLSMQNTLDRIEAESTQA